MTRRLLPACGALTALAGLGTEGDVAHALQPSAARQPAAV